MLAVIKPGGKQYKIIPGQKLKIEKLEKNVGEEITYEEVLLIENGKEVLVGKPFVAGAKVSGKITSQGRNRKVIIYKYKPKKRYRLKKGHRQPYTEIEIVKIEN